jgi:hypothetical protein
LFLNNGSGGFLESRSMGGSFVRQAGAARGLIVGDIDNDGDLDFVVTNNGEAARIFRNELPKRGSWLKVHVVDPRWRRTAIGAEVTVIAGSRRWLQIVQPASSYLASHDPRVHFGLGPVNQIDALEVLWPDGLRERFAGGPLNFSRELQRGAGTALTPAGGEPATPAVSGSTTPGGSELPEAALTAANGPRASTTDTATEAGRSVER